MTTQLTTHLSESTPVPARVRWPAVALYVIVSFGLGWLVTIPLWLDGGLSNPLAIPVAAVIMLAPAIAAFVALAVSRTPHPARFLGLTLGPRPRATVRFGLLGSAGAVVISLVAVLVAAAAGIVSLGLSSELALSLVMLPVIAFGIAIPAVGEEIGWRGFLQPALAPLGTWPALILTGVFWGLWHAPLVLLGYNYGSLDPIVLIPMTVTTMLIGVVIGWMRMRTDSIYPGALAHGALNASASVVPLGIVAVGSADPAATILGWAGWLVVVVVIALIIAARSLTWAVTPRAVGRSGSVG